MNLNTIYKYNVAHVYKRGNLDRENKVIEFITNYPSDYQIIDKTYDDCLLFDQVRKALPGVPLKEVFVLMDFYDFSKRIMKLQNFDNGIKLNIDGKIITFELFIKSNSMSRSFECYYINKEYKDIISKRITFGFNKRNLKISKWSAYLGLCCSSATILDDIHFNSDEVAIIKDKKVKGSIDCITAISVPYLLELLRKYERSLKAGKSANGIYDELNHYKYSADFDSLDEDIKHLIDEFLLLFKMNRNDAIERCKTIKEDYLSKCNNDEVNWNKIEVSGLDLDVNYFDGVGLISNDFSDTILNSLEKKNNHSFRNDHYSYQIRLPFVKGMVHSCDFHSFFKDHNVTQIKSIRNFTNGEVEYEYKSVKNIKMILSESQFKAAKYLMNLSKEDLRGCSSQVDYYFHMLKKYHYSLGICNIESEEDKNGRLNYQFLTTLPLTDNDIDYMIKVSKNEILNSGKLANIKEVLKENNYMADYLLADKYNQYYLNTKRYKDIRDNIVNKERSEALIGRIKCDSSRRYLCPDLLEFLYTIIEEEMPKEEVLDTYHFYAPLTMNEYDNKKDVDNTYGIILRNPHYSRNEIVVSKRSHNLDSERDYYFNHLYGVLMINPLSFYAERLGGADYDGDTVLFVNDTYYVKNMYDRLTKNGEFIYKLPHIPSLEENDSKLNYKTMLDSLNRTFSNQTGLISNSAFIKVIENSESNSLQDDLAFLTIKSGLEIDSAKSGLKPKLDISSNKDNLFLNVKNAIKEHNNSSIYYFTNTRVKKEIEKNKDEHHLYKIMDAINKYKPKIESSLKPKNYKDYLDLNDDYDKEGKAKVIGLVSGYKNLISLNKIYTINSKQAFTNKEIIEDWVKGIIRVRVNQHSGEDIDCQEFLSYFKSDRPKELLNLYTKNPYHFLDNEQDKVDFINKVLKLDLPDKVMKYVTNFNDKGYLLLYICLLYWKEDSVINFELDYSKLENNINIENLTDPLMKIANKTRKEFIKYIVNLNPLGSWKYMDLVKACKDYIDKYHSDITFNEVGNAIDLIKETCQFDLFSSCIVKYYESEGDLDE